MELDVPQTTFAHVNLPHGYRLSSPALYFWSACVFSSFSATKQIKIESDLSSEAVTRAL